MAITERQKPGSYYPAHNELFFVVESDNTAQDNFKFIFEVYVDATKVATVKVWPSPGTIYGVFDASEIVSSYLNNLYFKVHTNLMTSITADGNFSRSITVKYGEEYGSPVTSYLNLADSGAITIYNYVNNNSFISIDNQLTDFQNKWLTENRSIYARLGDNIYLSYFNTSGIGIGFSVNKYDAAGNQIGSALATTSSAAALTQLNIGSHRINTYSAGFIDSSVHSYTVYTGYDLSGVRVYLDCFKPYTNYHLVFLNRLGGYESFWFHGKAGKSIDINRKTFGKNPFDLDGYEMTKFNAGNGRVVRGKEQTNRVGFNYKYHLTSRFLTDAEFEYLYQLVTSPVIYLEMIDPGNSSCYYMPVKITASNYDFKTYVKDKISPLELDIEVLKDYKSQSA